MDHSETLIVFFSRTGYTRRLAQKLARALDADLCELREPRSRRGLLGYLRSGLEASRGVTRPLEALERDPSQYKRVVVGTPVWNASVSTPVRTFLATYCSRCSELAFFLTEGGRGEARVFQQMEQVAQRRPIATLALHDDQVDRGYSEQVDRFVEELRGAPPPARTPFVEGPSAPGP